MKARIKATGLIIDAVPFNITYENGRSIRGYLDIRTNIQYTENEIDFINIEMQYEFDYWEKLKHQYAGLAMQSYVNNNVYLSELRKMCKEPKEMRDYIADLSIALATALINKLKEEEK